MGTELRVAIASYGQLQFKFLHDWLTLSGHVPVVYLVTRSMRPSAPAEPDMLENVKAVVTDLPPGMDLLLPGRAESIAAMLAGYQPDLLLVFGCNWRLPRAALELPRLGALNVHPSALPKYRGPSPVPWAIRNGDPVMGLTVHRMTERIDAGPVLAQVTDIPIPQMVTSRDVWSLIKAALPDLLAQAIEAVARGDPGTPQDENEATYAGFPPPEWYAVNLQGDRRNVHNQIRVLRFLSRGRGPVIEFERRRVHIRHTSLTTDDGTRIECADGPLWLTYASVDLA